MINFLHTYEPQAILTTLGPINIYWYGVFIVVGVIIAIFITLELAFFYDIKKEAVVDLAFWLIICGVIGARLYHVALEWSYYVNKPIEIFKIWQGGLAIHGAIFVGLLCLWFYSIKKHFNFLLLTSLIVPGVALAQAIGRWGNYFNQELFGTPTDLAWGIPINIINRPDQYINNQFFHPAFLYESIGSLIIFLSLIVIHAIIIKKNQLDSTNYLIPIIFYLITYSLLRFFLEFIRIDPAHIIFNLRLPQVISIIIIFICFFIVLPNLKKHDSID